MMPCQPETKFPSSTTLLSGFLPMRTGDWSNSYFLSLPERGSRNKIWMTMMKPSAESNHSAVRESVRKNRQFTWGNGEVSQAAPIALMTCPSIGQVIRTRAKGSAVGGVKSAPPCGKPIGKQAVAYGEHFSLR